MILLVEDDDDIRDAVQDALDRRGYRTFAVPDGRAALDHLRATAELPGLILLDLTMPRMSGWEFLEHREADPALAAIPVVILSAVANVEEKPHAGEWAGVLTKPVTLDTLLETVRRFVEPDLG